MNQKKEIDTMIASEHICFPAFVFNNSFYANVKEMVSTYALKKMNEQYQKANFTTIQEPLLLCTKSFLSTMGLPCAHYIQHFRSSQSLMLDDIHESGGSRNIHQYHKLKKMIYKTIKTCLNLFYRTCEINTKISHSRQEAGMSLWFVHTRKHPSGSSNRQQTSSTRRDPSGFELVDHSV
ncbi:31513_t:CDS:2 [Gigaspora margarita]|uniref:31513_t:CDS:1 n=1 Tax=Gigaspora margarita TaxID=4874 RepID=A0ABN7UHD3_GIGMA|nr:31513_t:CDS:2 [Gigaspora margarita]